VLPYFNMFPVIESRNAYTAAKSPNRAGRHRRTRGIGRRWRNWWEFRWTWSGELRSQTQFFVENISGLLGNQVAVRRKAPRGLVDCHHFV
jgi:hypothetical protein